MSLAEDIKKYIDSKDDVVAYNKIKKEFFSDVLEQLENGKLSAEYLSRKISELSKEERDALFYKRSRGKASISSRAAQLISDIYVYYLGIPIRDLSLAVLVAEGLSDTNFNRICQHPYDAWLKSPSRLSRQVWLQRQLLSDLKLTIPEVVNTEILETGLKNGLDDGTVRLDDSFLTVIKRAPRFLTVLINKLYKQYQGEEREQEFTESLKSEILPLLDEQDEEHAERNQQLLISLVQTDVPILTALTKARPRFFLSLNQSAQKDVLNALSFEETTALEASLTDYLNKVDPVMAEHGLGEISNFLAGEKGSHEQSGSDSVLISLRDHIKIRQGEKAASFVHTAQARKALLAIRTYLQLNPDDYKSHVFSELASRIRNEKDISVEMLQDILASADLPRLFAKWSGPTRSRAAGLMTQLFNIASFGENLTPAEQQRMVTDGELPLVLDKEDKLDRVINNHIEQSLMDPLRARGSLLGRTVESELSVYKTMANLGQYNLGKNSQRAEAIYQQFLINKGIAIAERQDQPVFDTQGHVLLEVRLTQEDMDEIIGQITEGNDTQGSLEKLAAAMGVERITETTFCNLDVSFHPRLRRQFLAYVEASAGQAVNPSVIIHESYKPLPEEKSITSHLEELFDKGEQGSIIPLQEEMTMHASLALRAIERLLIQKGLLNANESIFSTEEKQQLFEQINKKVMLRYHAALRDSIARKGSLVVTELNKELDGTRKKLSSEVRELLRNAMREKLSQADNLDDYQAAIKELKKDHFTSTTGSALDYLHTDASNQLVMRVSATEETAHNKQKGANRQAFRAIARNRYNPQEETVAAFKHQAVDARVPSIAVLGATDAIRDVADKLAVDVTRLHNKNPGYRSPVVYNLLTSLYTRIGDNGPGANQQRESARLILQGAHLYNKEQLSASRLDSLVYVQNIPVNQHTLKLDPSAFDDVTREATLMTQMAMISSLMHYRAHLPPSLSESLAKAHERLQSNYFNYLNTDMAECPFYKDSSSGKESLGYFEMMRGEWKNAVIQPCDNDLHVLVAQVLLKALANGDYRNEQFGMLMQSLSIFIEPTSMAGCKSANERYQAVAGRVALLWSMAEPVEHSSKPKEELLASLKAYVNEAVPMKEVQKQLDIAYNCSIPYGGACYHSHADQGGPSKLEKTDHQGGKLGFFDFNTNIAESGYVDRLVQKNASSMQAHKVAKVMVEEFSNDFATYTAARDQELHLL
ncbi:hypothetical protein B1207_11795 [Legionella quinlivanii]|uniref:Uncharacterized protein n=1 Tax=Legionella quinlivanii TaxID=45073 RepID=A0A364LHN7_9GAMM|nr:hypothetical protein [Legionella quinlivanii]RAP35756.1 hypothetical protein B1207_11795 [Legionella quinlivanii]